MSDTSDVSGPDPARILASIGQAVIVTDLDGVVTYWNKVAEELYGWTAEEALGRKVEDLTVPNLAKEQAEEVMAALRKGTPWTGGFPAGRKDGTVFPALVTDASILREGEVIGIVGVSTNLGNVLRPFLERSTDAAIMLRSDAVITYASPAVQELFGWPEREVVGQPIVPFVHPDDRAALADFLLDLASNRGAHPPLELRVRKDGTWVWAEAAFTNLLDDPVVRGFVCKLRPSPRRAAQEQAETLASQLKLALDSRLIIEQAKGFLAGRDGVTMEAAFERLRRHARSNHLSIHDVCRRVVAGELVLPV